METKQVESIWNNSKLNDVPISSNDSLTLYDIACSDPLLNGSAVYQARAILDWDGFCASNQFRNSNEPTLGFDRTYIECVIYPNPSNGQFKITSNSLMSNIEIFDLNGILSDSYKVDTNLFELKNNLNNGIYVLRILFEDGNIEIHKISIQ